MENVTLQDLIGNLYEAKGWMKFIGVMMIIGGIFTAITIFGIIIAWLPIWLGVILYKSANLVEQSYLANSEEQFVEALANIKKYFTIQGIVMIVYLAFMGLAFFLGGTAALMNY
jgi:hypothetical protein